MSYIQSPIDSKIKHRFNLALLQDDSGARDHGSTMDSPQSAFGRRIRSRLAALSVNGVEHNQSWLAEQLGVSNEAVSRWILGKADPKLSNLIKMAEVLQCTPGYLCGDVQDDAAAELALLMRSLDARDLQSLLFSARTLLVRHSAQTAPHTRIAPKSAFSAPKTRAS